MTGNHHLLANHTDCCTAVGYFTTRAGRNAKRLWYSDGNMGKITVSPLPWYTHVYDILMVPVMFALRGFRTDSLQETHVWHIQLVGPKDIDRKLTIAGASADNSRYDGHFSFLFHAPIFGGWKNYSVYEVDQQYTPFHIGWIGSNMRTGTTECAVQRLPIFDTRIRMLDGTPSMQTSFFAVGSTGKQIPLRCVGHGRLGDGQYLSVRLF